MTSTDRQSARPLSTLLNTLNDRERQDLSNLVEKIYEYEEEVQFLDERGDVANRISQVVTEHLSAGREG